MKGGINILTKKEAKSFLNVCKSVNTIKFNQVIKDNNISYSAVSKFINYDEFDDFISINKLENIINDIVNSCAFLLDMYNEIINKVNIYDKSVCDIIKIDQKIV